MYDSEQLLDEVLMQIRTEAIPAFPQEQIAANLSAGRSISVRSVQPYRVRIGIGALAASLLILAMWLASMTDSGTVFAFTDVSKAVSKAHTIQFRVLHYSQSPSYLRQYNLKPGEPAVSQMVWSGDRMRNEQPLGIVIVLNPEKGLMMSMWASSRHAIIQPLPAGDVLKAMADYRAMLRDVSATNANQLPNRVENGRTLSEFSVRMHEQDFTVTVDPQTKLPIRMEVVYPKNLEQGRMADMREVYTDFIFDAPVDESLFRIEAPAGYSVENRIPPDTPAQPPESMNLTVSAEEGIGPAKFGMKVDEVVKLFGEPDWRREIPNPVAGIPSNKPGARVPTLGTVELDYHRRGFRVMVNGHYGLHAIHCDGSGDNAFRSGTKEGISLGASWEDVIKVYGKPDAQLGLFHTFYPKLGYEFEFRDKKLVAIQVSLPNPDVVVETHADGTISHGLN